MTSRPPRLASRRILRALEIAGIDPSARGLIAISLFVIVFIALFAEGVSELVGLINLGGQALQEELRRIVAATAKTAPLLVFLSWAYFRAKAAEEYTVPTAKAVRGPAACRVLVIFLSRSGIDAELAEELCRSTAAVDLHDPAVRRRFRGGWRYDRADFRLDITGGMKTASAAATAFALASEVPIQYVNTNDYSVWGFDIAFKEGNRG